MKALLDVPVWLYRWRLGALMLGRIVVVVHRGRKSGRRYESGLEVIDREAGEIFCFSAWGERADWYRNIAAGGVEELWDCSRRSAASFRRLEPEEAYGILSAYEQHHRSAARFFFPRMYPGYDFTQSSRRALAQQSVVVGFRPAG